MKRYLGIMIVISALVAGVASADWVTTTPGQVTTTDKVGISTTTPETQLHVVATTPVANRGCIVDQIDTGAFGPQFALRKARGTPGAMTATQQDDVVGALNALGHDGTAFIGTARVRFRVDGPTSTNNVPTQLQFLTGANNGGIERMRITSAGNVGIGVTTPVATLDVAGTFHVSSNVTIDGNIAAKYQDVAEWVEIAGNAEPGTVVVIAPGKNNSVVASNEAYDTRVAGVISAQPGLLLGEPSASKAKVATTGRVKIKVDATVSAIAVGDLLVTSAKHGFAMKSEAMIINGRKFHQPGTLIGKALEPLEKGTGEILVLLSLQ